MTNMGVLSIPTILGSPVAQMSGGDGMGWGMVMMAAMILLGLLLIGGAVWLVRDLARRRDTPSAPDDESRGALDVLDRRFAAGEVDEQEYRERRSVLEGH